ncbi:hypothetical protein P7C73_g2605, partial [Tremellales sp. Uapishka_1]
MPAKIIIDTDPGVDDVLAILLGLASPEIDVALISIVFGNTHAPVAHANLLKIYHLLSQEIASLPAAEARYARLGGQVKTVLALGEDGPIGGKKAVAAYFHGQDGLSNISETHPAFTPPALSADEVHDHLDISKKPAYEEMLDLLRAEPAGTVTIVALGPLTNIAHAFRSDAESFNRVAKVVWMGGALDVPGNTSPTAEFNCFADPYAAAEVLKAVKEGAFRLIMAPLDITTPHQIPFSDLIHPSLLTPPEEAPPPTPLQAFTGSMLLRVRGLQASFGLPDAMEMHDPVAVWYAIENAGTEDHAGWKTVKRDFAIERNGELTRGMCVVDRRGAGEELVDRTKSKLLNSKQPVPSLPPKDETVDRMGAEVEKAKQLPEVIYDTPGSEVLRKVLLARVFGTKV